MSDEFILKPPLLKELIPKQIVTVGSPFRLDLNEYIENSIKEEDLHGEDPSLRLLYTIHLENKENLPYDLEYTIGGQIYGQLRPTALNHSPYLIHVVVDNGAKESLKTAFELEVLPAKTEEEAWSIDEELNREFSNDLNLTPEEEKALYQALEEQEKKESTFTDEKQAIWQALLKGESLPELQALIDRPIQHYEVYYLLSRMAYFVIWNADNPEPAGKMKPLILKEASKHFNIYDRGSCLCATPKQLFDHNRTLFDAIKTAQAMANEVFNRNWSVELGGFDKMVRAAWIELEILSEKANKSVHYAYFYPSPHDLDSLNQTKNIRLK